MNKLFLNWVLCFSLSGLILAGCNETPPEDEVATAPVQTEAPAPATPIAHSEPTAPSAPALTGNAYIDAVSKLRAGSFAFRLETVGKDPLSSLRAEGRSDGQRFIVEEEIGATKRELMGAGTQTLIKENASFRPSFERSAAMSWSTQMIGELPEQLNQAVPVPTASSPQQYSLSSGSGELNFWYDVGRAEISKIQLVPVDTSQAKSVAVAFSQFGTAAAIPPAPQVRRAW